MLNIEPIKSERGMEGILKARDWDTADAERTRFIHYCIERRMTYEEIAKILHITKQRVYQIIRYGSPRMSVLTRRQVIKRDQARCRICNMSTKTPHIHHLEDPKDNSLENLLTLCPKCHKRFDMYQKQIQELSTGTT